MENMITSASGGSSRDKEVKYFVDGECVSPNVLRELAEEDNYMIDYVFGEEGKLSEIRLDRID